MSLSISNINPSEYRSNVNLEPAPYELLSQVLQYKSNKAQQSFQALQSYKQTALNINFINKERQGEVDGINKDIEKRFADINGEFGDLANNEIANKYTQIFDGFKKNTDLISAYNVDKKWQSEHSMVQGLKNSKDPTKSGYSAVNEYVFSDKLNKYANSNKQTPVDFKGYTPYKDVVAETTRMYKSLPKKEWTETIPDEKHPGYMKTVKMSGYDEDDMHRIIDSLGGDLQEQFRVEAEYNQLKGIATNPTAYRENLHNDYTKLYQDSKTRTESQLNQVIQQQAIATTPEDKNNLAQTKLALEKKITELGLNVKSKDWFLTTSEDNLLGLSTQLHTQRKVGGLAKGLSNRPSIEYKPDLSYYKNMQLRQANDHFNANLGYRKSQDNIQNQFRQADIMMKAKQAADTKQFNYDKLSVENGGVVAGVNDSKSTGGTNSSSSMFSSDSEFTQADNQLPSAAVESYGILETKISQEAFNIADGNNYNKRFMGQDKQSNDQIIEKVISMYDDNAIGKSTEKIKTYLNEAGLNNNISLNILVDGLPMMLENTSNLNIKNKVGVVKTLTNNILNGDSSTLNGKYNQFAPAASMYRNKKQEEVGFLTDKASYWNQTVKDMPEKDYNKMSAADKATMATRVSTLFMQNNKTGKYAVQTQSYQALGEKPVKGQEKLWQERSDAARIIKEKSGVTFDIDESLISSAVKHEDGTTLITFKGEADFKKAYGDNWQTATEHNPWGWSGDRGFFGGGSQGKIRGNGANGIEKGSFIPNGFVVIKQSAMGNTSPVDRMLSNNNKYSDIIKKDGQNISLEVENGGDYWTITVNGVRHQQPKKPNQKPSEVIQVIKNEILR